VPTDVVLCIEGQPYCLGEHGALNGKKSIKIKKIFEREAGSS
jgi:flagellar motor switch protein FliM